MLGLNTTSGRLYTSVSNGVSYCPNTFGAGAVRMNGPNMEVFNGYIWDIIATPNIGLTSQTEAVLAWAEQKMNQENVALEAAKKYKSVQMALDAVKQAEADLAETLIMVSGPDQKEPL